MVIPTMWLYKIHSSDEDTIVSERMNGSLHKMDEDLFTAEKEGGKSS